MSNPYIDNADRWLAIAEADYLTLYVKAWIPFNAWYRNSYPTIKTDRETINTIKSNSNLFRDKLHSLLRGRDNVSFEFKQKIAQLYHTLEATYIPNADNRISFEQIVIEMNPDLIKVNQHRGWNFKVELIYNNAALTSYNINILVTAKNGTTKYSHSQNKYDLTNLTNHIDTVSVLNNHQKDILKQTYLFINPKKTTNLITNSKDGLVAGDIKLVNDVDKISKGVIEILYKLRCILFHGELNPSKENQKAYEPAFYILKTLVTSLK